MDVFFKVFSYPTFMFEHITPSAQLDWSAIYFQFSIEHALRYATDKEPKDDIIICLTKFKLKENHKISIHVLKDPIFASMDIKGIEKANIAKRMLNIPQEEKLMTALNGILILYDNPDDLEIVISHNVIKEENMVFENVAQFLIKNHIITHWRKYGDLEWIKSTPAESISPHLLCIKL